MANGQNAGHNQKCSSYEYWASRHPKLMCPGRFTKTQTHRYERRQAKLDIKQRYEDYQKAA